MSRMILSVYVPTWPRVAIGWALFGWSLYLASVWMERGDVLACVFAGAFAGIVVCGATYDTVRAWQAHGIRGVSMPEPACCVGLGDHHTADCGVTRDEYIASVFDDVARAGGPHIDDDHASGPGELSPEACMLAARFVRRLAKEER